MCLPELLLMWGDDHLGSINIFDDSQPADEWKQARRKVQEAVVPVDARKSKVANIKDHGGLLGLMDS